jgi:hypothetical protein
MAVFKMAVFKVTGWYRYKDQKYFETVSVEASTPENAAQAFKNHFANYSFYKIEIS